MVLIKVCLLLCILDASHSHPDASPGWSKSSQEKSSPAQNQLLSWASNQSYSNGNQIATNSHGNPVPSLTASQTVGKDGPILLQDYHLLAELSSLNRERIPERVVHAKGAGAHGHFVLNQDLSHLTKAKFLCGSGKKTRVFVRFSTFGGEQGSSDTVADPNGFSVKFYTQDGNHDLIGNNIEPFPIRDPMLFRDMAHSRKRNPQTNLRDRNMWWDFTSLRPEATLQTLHLFSDLGRPDGYRRMDGFSSHAFRVVNDSGHQAFVKFSWKSLQPGQALSYQQAAELAGSQPDYKVQDLYDAIERKDYPKWNLTVQVMTLDQARKHHQNPFDITKTWKEKDFPRIPVGTLTLTKNPTDYFTEVEQVGFAVSNLVPGIEPSPDEMLAARLFAYEDALKYRLGVNWPQLPINHPDVHVNSYARNGRSCFGPNGHGGPNYYPNSFGSPKSSTHWASQSSFHVDGIVDRYDFDPADDHSEPRYFIEHDIDFEHRKRLVQSLADHLKDASPEIRERALKNLFYPISAQFGNEIREAVDMKTKETNRPSQSSVPESHNHSRFSKFFSI